MLDIELFRADKKGGDVAAVRESQKRRFVGDSLVDEVIQLDTSWRAMRGVLDKVNQCLGVVSKTTGKKLQAKEAVGEDLPLPDAFTSSESIRSVLKADELESQLNITQLKKLSGLVSLEQDKVQKELDVLEANRDSTLRKVGNLVHESVTVSDNEDDNPVEVSWGEELKECVHRRNDEDTEPFERLNHVDLMHLLGGMDTEQGTRISGNRCYFLKGGLVRLQMALIQFSQDFLINKEYSPMYVPFFMNKETMGEVAQLSEFDEALYHVSGDENDSSKYLIATSEQPLCAYHRNKWIDPNELPFKYAGYSTCFRKEAGSHGRDTAGIFRVHQFEKIEQFVVCTPKDGESWKLFDEMLSNAQEFYQKLKIPYRVVTIVSGAINNAAAKKCDLEGYYPASKTYRELVSCSNCTDYQSRNLLCRYGKSKKTGDAKTEFCHMLNSTLCAITRVLCIICELYQTQEGIVVPEVLRNYMPGAKERDFIPFVKPRPKPATKKEKQEKNAN